MASNYKKHIYILSKQWVIHMDEKYLHLTKNKSA